MQTQNQVSIIIKDDMKPLQTTPETSLGIKSIKSIKTVSRVHEVSSIKTPLGFDTDTILMRYETALSKIPKPGGGGCHTALLRVANFGAFAGLTESIIFTEIRANIPTGSRRVSDQEIRVAVQKAKAECIPRANRQAGRTYNPRRTLQKPRKLFDGIKARNKIIEASRGASEAELSKLSPYRITWKPGRRDAVVVLENLYALNEYVFIGDFYNKGVNSVSEWIKKIKAGYTAPHIILNPLTGKKHPDKSGKPSFRCDDAISDYRFVLVEFDEMPKAEQVCFWHTIITEKLLSIAALIDSGNKSIHAWVRVDLADSEAWRREIKDGLYNPETGRMSLLGADRACQNPSRLSRLAGHKRKNGNVQRLIYLNPELKNYNLGEML